MSGLMCSGNVLISRLGASDVRGPFADAGNTIKLAITGAAKTVTRESRQRDDYGQSKDNIVIPGASTIELTSDDAANGRMLAISVLGTATPIDSAGGTVATGSPLSIVAALDGWVPLGHEDVSSVVVKSDDVTPDTYVLGVDYELNPRLGMIRALSTGDIEEADVLKVSLTYAAQSGTLIEGSADPIQNVAILLDGKNLATGEDVIVEVDCAQLGTKNVIDFMSATPVQLTLSGTLKTLEGKTSPWRAKLKKAAA